jgi:hypothetical protein
VSTRHPYITISAALCFSSLLLPKQRRGRTFCPPLPSVPPLDR